MTVEETIDKMIKLRLPHMAQALRAQLDRAVGSALTVEECVGLMVDREWTERENRRTGRRVKDAKLGMQACLEDVWCDPARGLDKAVVRSLGTCGWVRAKQNVIVVGMTGTGKSYLGAALAEAACVCAARAPFFRDRSPGSKMAA
jgi:DNA replication protein DnaC